MAIEATLIIDPGTSSSTDKLIVAELDDVMNVDETGQTISQFSPGELVYFRIHKSTDVSVTDIIPTDGSIQSLGSVYRPVQEDFVFASREISSPPEHKLSRIPANSLLISELGRQGDPSIISAFNGVITLQASIDQVPFLSRVTYNYRCDLYVLRTPYMELNEDETYPIVVVIYTNDSGVVSNACSNS